eukprot:1189152-Prorocentrum_minimum.AAC.2
MAEVAMQDPSNTAGNEATNRDRPVSSSQTQDQQQTNQPPKPHGKGEFTITVSAMGSEERMQAFMDAYNKEEYR